MDTEQITRPRRFTFSLRLLFTFLTACCIYAGWHASLVNQRRVMRCWVESGGGRLEAFYLNKRETTLANGMVLKLGSGHGPKQTDFELPLIRQWLGDEPIWTALMRHDASEDEIAKFKRLFPEVEQFEVAAPPGAGTGMM